MVTVTVPVVTNLPRSLDGDEPYGEEIQALQYSNLNPKFGISSFLADAYSVAIEDRRSFTLPFLSKSSTNVRGHVQNQNNMSISICC